MKNFTAATAITAATAGFAVAFIGLASPADPDFERRQRGDQRVPASSVSRPHPPNMPVVVTAADELGKSELLDR
ncbi:MAG: hypothetical protein U1C73_14690, partial [Dietzia sp.]|nr:hypothetical protein [Dietzia sp.]